MRYVLISSATSDASLYGWLFLSSFMTSNLVFRVLISLLIMPIARWSSTGANIILMFFLHYVMNFFALVPGRNECFVARRGLQYVFQ